VINYTVINKTKPKTAVFVHGLFANSGYWLSYLPYIRDHKLIILNISYQFFDEVSQYVDEVTEIIEQEAGGVVDVAISHSLGSVLTNQLRPGLYRKLFEICPVYCASRRNIHQFIDEIQVRIGQSLSTFQISEMLERVDLALSEHFSYKENLIGSIKYYPNADPFFSYNLMAPSKIFNGDHFEISGAMMQIQDELCK